MLMHIRHPVSGRENCLPHGPRDGGLAAPEHALEPEVFQLTRKLRRAAPASPALAPFKRPRPACSPAGFMTSLLDDNPWRPGGVLLQPVEEHSAMFAIEPPDDPGRDGLAEVILSAGPVTFGEAR